MYKCQRWALGAMPGYTADSEGGGDNGNEDILPVRLMEVRHVGLPTATRAMWDGQVCICHGQVQIAKAVVQSETVRKKSPQCAAQNCQAHVVGAGRLEPLKGERRW